MAVTRKSGVVRDAGAVSGSTVHKSGSTPKRQQAYAAKPAKMLIADAET